MAKILELNPSSIYIGTDDHRVIEVPTSSLHFVPHVGDEVEIFETDQKVIVSKLENRANNNVNITYQSGTWEEPMHKVSLTKERERHREYSPNYEGDFRYPVTGANGYKEVNSYPDSQQYAPVYNQENLSNNTVDVLYVHGKIVNKTTYVLFAIFLGSFGVHKFYSKKILAGVLYAVFSFTGIPAILGFIEGIIGILKKADSDGNIVV